MTECEKSCLTEDDIESCIASEDYFTVGRKTTVCCLRLKNGFEVVGTSACVDASSYDFEKGKPCARKRAIDKVWEVEGYRLQCVNWKPEENYLQPSKL